MQGFGFEVVTVCIWIQGMAQIGAASLCRSPFSNPIFKSKMHVDDFAMQKGNDWSHPYLDLGD